MSDRFVPHQQGRTQHFDRSKSVNLYLGGHLDMFNWIVKNAAELNMTRNEFVRQALQFAMERMSSE